MRPSDEFLAAAAERMVEDEDDLVIVAPLQEHLAGKHDQKRHAGGRGSGEFTGLRDAMLQESERSIMGEPVENLVIIGHGGIVRHITGDRDSVELSAVEKEAIVGRVVTHNHPAHEQYGGGTAPLSSNDIRVAAYHRAAEIRAVNPDGTVYSLKPSANRDVPRDGWGVLAHLNESMDKRTAEVISKYRPLVKTGLIGAHEANRRAGSEMLVAVANDMDYRYEVTHVDA